MRWWDGEKWTDHVQPAPPPPVGGEEAGISGQTPADTGPDTTPATPALTPEDESAATSGVQSPAAPAEPPMSQESDDDSGVTVRLWHLVAGGAALIAAVVIVVVVASGGGDDSSSDAYAECNRELRPVMSEIQSLGGHLDVGLNQADYSSQVGDLQAVYNGLEERHISSSCRPVVLGLGEAVETYAVASSEWGECIYNLEEGCERTVEKMWSEADKSIATSKRRMATLRTGGPDGVEELEAESKVLSEDALAKVQAHTAQIAIETYANEHGGSYEGATSAKLRSIDPNLPAGLEVSEVGLTYYVISVSSEGGEQFKIERAPGGAPLRLQRSRQGRLSRKRRMELIGP
jgi:hypothetical protein